jgi:cyanophycin synthetase
VIFFAHDGDLPAIVEHRGRGGRAVFVRAGEIVFGNREQDTVITSLRLIPLTDAGRSAAQVEHVLAAAAAAWALGIAPEIVRTALETATAG